MAFIVGVKYMNLNGKEEKMNYKNIRKTMCLAVVSALLLSGCKKNPEKELVVQKDMDNMIIEATDEDNGVVDVAEVVPEGERYTEELGSDELKVNVKVDAVIKKPDVENLSIYRVSQAKITQDMIDRLVKAVMDEDDVLYDLGIDSIRSKKEIEEEMNRITEDYSERIKNANESDAKVYEADMQSTLESLRAEYENAPDQIDYSRYISDGKLHKIDELQYKLSDYDWIKSLNPDGEIFRVVNSQDVYEGKKIYAQNNENYGNFIRYSYGKYTTGSDSKCLDETWDLEPVEKINDWTVGMIWKYGEDIPAHVLSSGNEFTDYNEDPVTIDMEQAKSIAEEFLKELEIEGFGFYMGGIYNEVCEGKDGGMGYKSHYILQYTRIQDGVHVEYTPVAKFQDQWEGESYNKRFWADECIQLRINDSGILSFEYNIPLKVDEVVVEKAALKSFDEIKEVFREMVLVKYAATEDFCYDIEIDQISLNYARISERDSFDTGLYVPVWEFKGKTYEYTDKENGLKTERYGSVICINAIDGSVIDHELGY